MAITREYIDGIALVYRKCKERSPERKALHAKILATGTSPDFVYGGASNEDTVHGVNDALQTLKTLSLKAPDVTKLLEKLRPLGGSSDEPQKPKPVTSAKPKSSGDKSDVGSHESKAAAKAGGSD